jgi:acetyl-CoA synthetase
MHLEQILHHTESFSAPAHLIAQANLSDFAAEYARSLADPAAFWGAWAQRFQC